MKQKLTLALSDDVVAIIRKAGPRRMGEFVEALVRRAENPPAGFGILERIDENLAALVEKGGKV